MITKIEVNGFKSLSNFNLNLNKGINILVGPNGVGKTNVILFFEFLSKICVTQISEAVSSVGGVGSIFKKVALNTYQDFIDFKIYGCTENGNSNFLTYEYEVEIKSSFEKDNIYYRKQRIKLHIGEYFHNQPNSSNYDFDWDLDIIFQEEDNDNDKFNVNILNKDKIKSHHFSHENDLYDSLIDFYSRNNLNQSSIINSLYYIVDFSMYVYQDLIGGETFNIVPSRVKEQEDAASPTGIKKDGSGLVTTLYAMKKSKPKNSGSIYFPFFFDSENTYKPETLKRIIKYLQLANKTIRNLEIENNAFDNKLVVKVSFDTGSYKAQLPLSAMSDGTIKWLTLITAILTSREIFSIEEPENFLHPWMQAEILNIMRNHIEEKGKNSFVLMTTHSESLINHSKPEELIIVGFNYGITYARRIEEIDVINNEISNSGFGLGHFYFSDIL